MSESQLKELWKHVNISTLLVLPIFQDILKECNTKRSPHIPYPVQLLALEYGLLNTYLYDSSEVFDTLKLVFQRDVVLSDLDLTDSNYYCFGDRLIDSKYFKTVRNHEDLIVYELEIPIKYYKDIKLITDGKYSKVSDEYKDLLHIKQRAVPKIADPRSKYIITHNIPYAIVVRGTRLKEHLDEVLGVNLDKEDEFYTKFNPEKEKLSDFLQKESTFNSIIKQVEDESI